MEQLIREIHAFFLASWGRILPLLLIIIYENTRKYKKIEKIASLVILLVAFISCIFIIYGSITVDFKVGHVHIIYILMFLIFSFMGRERYHLAIIRSILFGICGTLFVSDFWELPIHIYGLFPHPLSQWKYFSTPLLENITHGSWSIYNILVFEILLFPYMKYAGITKNWISLPPKTWIFIFTTFLLLNMIVLNPYSLYIIRQVNLVYMEVLFLIDRLMTFMILVALTEIERGLVE